MGHANVQKSGLMSISLDYEGGGHGIAAAYSDGVGAINRAGKG